MARQLTVYDECGPCPYLPDRIARMPLRLPTDKLAGSELDRCLAEGDRRSGMYLYRTICPDCQACEAIRIAVGEFVPRRAHRRVLRKGDRRFEMRVASPEIDSDRVRLFNAHRNLRGLAGGEVDISADDYSAFLIESCTDTIELTYLDGERLVAVALSDLGDRSLSAVYCFFDPEYSKWSPGNYSILKQLELCEQLALDYLYLGYHVAASRHMSYKANYRPHERLIDGHWQWFE